MMLMKKIDLKDGVCMVPEEWITVYIDPPEDCVSAHVVICRNEDKFEVPRFIVLSAMPYGKCVSDVMQDEIYAACSRKFARFPELLDQQVTLVPDEHYTPELAELWSGAPCFDIFRIPEYLDPDLWKPGQPEYIPPCGAVIVRYDR